jgi:hypothetical protein
MSQTTHILNVEADDGFKMLGIVSTYTMSKLVWELNRVLKMDLKREKDLDINSSEGKAYHAIGRYIDEENLLNIALLKNKGTAGFLLPKFKQMDYLLIELVGYGDSLFDKEKINSSKGVQYSLQIDSDPIWIDGLGIFEL